MSCSATNRCMTFALMKNSQQHLGNEANVTLRKNINLVPRLLSHLHTMLYF